MADANLPMRAMPSNWSEAFGAMPLEHAPGGAWSAVAQALPAAAVPHPIAPRRSPWRAIALVASVVIALPVAWWLAAMPDPDTGEVAATSANVPGARVAPVASASGTPATVPAAPPAARGRSREPSDVPSPVGVMATGTSRHSVSATPAPSKQHAGASTIASHPHRTVAASLVGAPKPTGAVAMTDASDSPDASLAMTSPTPRLDALRTESARLEALVAYARDDRMASAAAAVMSASLDDRIRLIDAALMQPDLADDMQASLWDQRVGTLQELAALEGTQRWMAAHGASMDAVARVD